jgi:DNA-binding transcriptional LysR family regulator
LGVARNKLTFRPNTSDKAISALRLAELHSKFGVFDRRRGLESLSALSAFVRAAEAESFTDAGRQLGLSSSAIGKAVTRLEERLGVRLLHRTTRKITLTQEGIQFLDSCRRILAEIERIQSEFAQSKGTARGRLRVSLPVVGMLMMPVISDFLRAYPEIELDMDFNDHLVDVVEGGYDVVVRSGESVDSSLKSRVLGSYSLQLVGAPAYFAKAGTPATPEELLRHACLHHKYPTSGRLQRWPIVRAEGWDYAALPATAIATTVEALLELAVHGVGIACIPDFAARKQIAEGALVRILQEHVDHTATFRAMWPSSRYITPKVRAFIDFMAEHLFARAS